MLMRVEPWNLLFFIGFIAYLTIRGVYAQRAKGKETLASRVDALERVLLFVVIASSVLLPLLYLFTPALAFADYRLPVEARWCGTLVMIAALWLFWRSHADLGDNWSVSLELRKDHQLIQRGVYRFIRHPMYASLWLWGLAQGLLLENWLAGWCALVTFGILYFVRTPREEMMMCEFFGQQYRDYMRRTGRLLPRLRPRS
jgi:protein-S-isoprenylcysteine O-methyltransferase Ste14